MSEMTEVNHSRPSFNGTDSLRTSAEGLDNGASTAPPLKTSIPMQEVSAVREQLISAAAHSLASDDQSTVSAANAAVEENRPAAMSSSIPDESLKTAIEGPGHESDVRGSNGVGLAGHVGQMERQSNEEVTYSSQPSEANIPAGELFNMLKLDTQSRILKEVGVAQIQCLSRSL